MKELITRIQRYIRELGAFDIENVDTNKVVEFGGNKITYFDLDVVKVVYDNDRFEYVFYRDLSEDTLVVILEVLKEYKHKWEQYKKSEV